MLRGKVPVGIHEEQLRQFTFHHSLHGLRRVNKKQKEQKEGSTGDNLQKAPSDDDHLKWCILFQ